MRNILVGLLICLCTTIAPNVSQACHHTIQSVILDPVTACEGDDVTVTVQVELYGKWYDVRKWKSTSIDSVCYEHDDHVKSNGKQTFTETFTITAPGTQGLGNVQVKTFANNGCGNHQKTKNVDLTVIECCNECEDGDDCIIEQGDGYVTITCGDTIAYLYDGEDGEDGEDGPQGPQGIPGLSCTVEQDGSCSYIACEDGTSSMVCDGEDGESCYVTQEGDCAVIYCGDKTMATICDGADGEDGIDGTSCWVENRPRKAIIHCGRSQASVWNGLSCWDLNSNRRRDFCDPCLQNMFDGECPSKFVYEYQCETPDGPTNKARLIAKEYEGHTCEIEVDCIEYVMSQMDISELAADNICAFTEDTTRNGEINILDCRGEDGSDGLDGYDGLDGETGPQGPQGPPGRDGRDGEDGVDGTDGKDGLSGPQGPPGHDGFDGQDGADGVDGIDGIDGINGADGVGCDTIDNLDATCTIICDESTVLVYNCGIGAELKEEILTGLTSEEEEVAIPKTCGAFDGLTVVAMLLPLGLMRFRYGV